MKILIAHNRYQQQGGEDVVFENEVQLLTRAGHNVKTLIVSNNSIVSYRDKVQTLLRTAENPVGIKMMSLAIDDFHPDIVHVHNYFPLLSPAIYRVCAERRTPVVQTLHNYRALCANGLLLRDGKICDLCVKGTPAWGIVHRCYRNSLPGSAAVARMISYHRRKKSWFTLVSRYIALTEFSRQLFIDAGFPSERIDVKPNFLEDPRVSSLPDLPRNGVLYVGRLSPEKGVKYLIEACRPLGLPLRIVGGGTERAALQSRATPNVTFLGTLSRNQIFSEMSRAAAVAVPSIWYEPFPMVILEAFACGTPVIVSRMGGLPNIVIDGSNGFVVRPADSPSLGARIEELLREPDKARAMGTAARQTFLTKYSAEANLAALEAIYERAIQGVAK